MKKISRRNFLVASGLTAGAALLAACGGGDASSTAGSTAASTAGDKTTIAYWTTNRHDQAFMTPHIHNFNATNDKNIFIDFQVYADNYSQMVDLAFSTNTAPDVYQLTGSSDLYTTVNEKKLLLDLAPFMDDAYRARFGEGAFVEGINSIGDGIYTLPYTGSAARLFYNRGIFNRLGIAEPKTVQEMVDAATKITNELKGEGVFGIAGNYKSAMSAVMRSIDMVNMRSGGNRCGFDYSTGTYDFTCYKPILEAFKAMYSTGIAFPGSESLDIDPLRTQFAAGKIGMYMSITHAEPGVYASQFPTEEDWTCCPLPTLSGNVDGYQQLWMGGSNTGINPATADPEAAWAVMEFLHSDEVMAPYHEQGLGTVLIPSAVAKATPPAMLAAMPNLELNEYDVNFPPMPTLVVEGKDYATVWVECIFGVTDIDKAIEDVNTRYNAAYDKAVADGAKRIVYPNFSALNHDTTV